MSSDKQISIAALKEKLIALPQRERDADAADLYKRYLLRMTKSHDAAAAIQCSVDLIEDEFGEFDPAPAKEKLSRVCDTAKKLRKRLLEDASAGACSDTEKAVLWIAEGVDQFEAVAKKSWRDVLQRRTAGPEVLVPVLTKLIPADGAKLGEAVRRATATRGQLPATRQAAKAARAGLNDVDAVLSRLKLDEKVADFLRQIAGPNGATLAALSRPEIAEFIKQHRLTSELRVHLGSVPR